MEAAAFFARVPHEIAWRSDPGLALQAPGPDIETEAIRSAGAKRRREFRSGRNLARAVLEALGQPVAALPVDTNRRPVWPDGIAGSITHCDDLAVAVAARGISGIGVDVECARPLPADVSRYILTSADIELSPHGIDLWPTQVFCAKEAFYKAVSYGLSFVPNFDEAAICPLGADAFRVIPLSDRLRETGLAGGVRGWHARADDHMLAVAVLPGQASDKGVARATASAAT